MQHIGYWINQQQTLITGIAALVVGGVTVFYLRRQIQQTQELAREQQIRRLRAVRAGLPFALSEVHDYAEKCIDVLCHFLSTDGSLNGDEEYDFERETEERRTVPSIPPFPAEPFKVLQTVIEHSDGADAAKLQEILAYAQIQKTRFQKIVGRLVHNEDPSWSVLATNVMGDVRDAVGLLLHIERLYDFARGISSVIHDLPDASVASDKLLWKNKGGQATRDYVVANWPPDFPRRIPVELQEPKAAPDAPV